MHKLLVVVMMLAVVGCADESPQARPDAGVTEQMSEVDQIAARVHGVEQLVAQPDHKNCGEMVYCRNGGEAQYCYFSQKSTGCTDSQIAADAQSDCQYVCGHTLCLELSVNPCR